jgi:hypothetical protein
VIVQLPTELLVRYRAVDREVEPAAARPPDHLDRLTHSIRHSGVVTPLRLCFSYDLGYLCGGNHRLAAALRLGLAELPVVLCWEKPGTRRDNSQPMRPEDLDVLFAAVRAATTPPAHLDLPA